MLFQIQFADIDMMAVCELVRSLERKLRFVLIRTLAQAEQLFDFLGYVTQDSSTLGQSHSFGYAGFAIWFFALAPLESISTVPVA
jgi:hypothetical protein